MLLAIDAGNTNVAFALYDGESKKGEWRCATDPRRTADEYAVWLFELLRLGGFKPADISACILASVVPDATFNLKRLCSQHCGAEPLVIGEPGCDLGIEVRYAAFPRSGPGQPSAKIMESIWCAEDRQEAMTEAKLGNKIETLTCDNPVNKQFALGQQVGVQGTPAIFMANGVLLPGYKPAAELAEQALANQ